MGLSNLRQVSVGTFEKAHMNTDADVVIVDNPDPRVLPEIKGWTDATPNDMYFMLTLYPNTDYRVTVGSEVDTLTLQVLRTDRPTIDVVYWAVDMEEDLETVHWILDFDVYNDEAEPEEQYTGKWKFSKGKVHDDEKVV